MLAEQKLHPVPSRLAIRPLLAHIALKKIGKNPESREEKYLGSSTKALSTVQVTLVLLQGVHINAPKFWFLQDSFLLPDDACDLIRWQAFDSHEKYIQSC